MFMRCETCLHSIQPSHLTLHCSHIASSWVFTKTLSNIWHWHDLCLANAPAAPGEKAGNLVSKTNWNVDYFYSPLMHLPYTATQDALDSFPVCPRCWFSDSLFPLVWSVQINWMSEWGFCTGNCMATVTMEEWPHKMGECDWRLNCRM